MSAGIRDDGAFVVLLLRIIISAMRKANSSENSQYAIDDPFVSNKHLWIYTVIFDQDNPGEVAPLVYAQDISMNGTLWNGYRMGNGRSSFLLSYGDILRLSETVYLKYNSEDHSQAKCFTARQAVEMRVSYHFSLL
jgi:protein-serine/threonine kinase